MRGFDNNMTIKMLIFVSPTLGYICALPTLVTFVTKASQATTLARSGRSATFFSMPRRLSLPCARVAISNSACRSDAIGTSQV